MLRTRCEGEVRVGGEDGSWDCNGSSSLCITEHHHHDGAEVEFYKTKRSCTRPRFNRMVLIRSDVRNLSNSSFV
jgi:hypothetical protein